MSALRNTFFEQAPSHLLSGAKTTPARELSWSLPAAIIAVTAVLTVGGILIELRLPGALELFNPKRLIGVNQMAFETVFMVRVRWPDLFEAAATVGAMAAFSAIGCAILHALSQRIAKSSSLLLILPLLLTAPDIANALDFRRDGDTLIRAGDTITETLVCSGDVVTIDGTIDGDLIVASKRFTLRGTVTGDLYFFAGEAEIAGEVQGSIVGVGERVNIDGIVGGALTLGGNRLTVTDDARIGRDLALFGEGVRVSGQVPRDVTFAGEWIEVRATIARDLHILGADRVELFDGARIGRNLRAHLLGRRHEIEQAPGAVVDGEIQLSTDSLLQEHYLAHYKHPRLYVMLIIAAAAAFLFGLVLYLIEPRLFEIDAPDARGFGRSLGIGFIGLLAGPVALLLIGMSVVGIPLAVFGFFALIVAVYTSFVLVAGLCGQAVLKPSAPGLGAFAPSLLIGVIGLSIVAALPFVGPAIRIIAILFGLGTLIERTRAIYAWNLRGIRD